MAYKVLGQSTSTAAASSAVVNLIKDPSFEGLSFNEYPVTLNNGYQWIDQAKTPWKTFAATNLSMVVSTAQNTGLPAAYGNQAIGFRRTASSSNTHIVGIGIGKVVGASTSDTSWNSATFGNGYPLYDNTCIPVTAGTTYYWGVSSRRYSSFSTPTIRVQWWGGPSAGTVATSTATLTTGSSWTRDTGNFVAPSGAQYCSIDIYGTMSTSGDEWVMFDGITFGTSSGYNSSYVDPSSSSTYTALTSPFTTRYQPGFTGTLNNSTVANIFSGAFTTLYTVPAGSSAVVSTITVSNPTTSDTKFKVAVVPSGQTLDNKHFISFDTPIAANSTQTITIGMTLAAGDTVRTAADVSNVSFTAFGNEG